eukprot:TRINITY_DN7578_c0_g2_i3.p1 TRINITY_DN7578_c0_g2~~TRINITY_DN7578_c0_g2_i3.p1  ORF type:complete len:145 (+),score=33.57 TRINITY_DN7578_c0_g2_i3:41-475(+)
MMRCILALSLVLLVGLSHGLLGAPATPLCPMSLKPVDMTGDSVASISFHANKIYFCCNGCLKTFVQNILDYVKDTPDPLDPALLGTQVECAVTGTRMTVSPSSLRLQLDNGQDLFFHTPHCLKNFKHNPSAYITAQSKKEADIL